MKKIILILTLIFTTSLFAQYNLEFSRAINTNLEANEQLTVPEGKVWKIQDWANGNGQGVTDPGTISIWSPDPDGQITTYQGQWNGMHSKPLWVPAQYKVGNSNGRTSVNILEFSLITAGSSGSGGSDGSDGSGGGGSGSGGFDSGSGLDFGSDYTDGPSLTDNDGNVYETVVIGGQTWTTTNLNVSTYRDGTPIPHITDLSEWANSTIGAYTYFLQNDSGYGKIYNGHAVLGKHDNDPNTPLKQLAPEGYHIPSKNEYETLISLYVDLATAWVYLKTADSWYQDYVGNNESGLNIKDYGYLQLPYAGYTVGWNENQNPGITRFFTRTLASEQAFEGFSMGITNCSFANIEFKTYNSSNNDLNDGAYIRLIKN